MFTTIKNSITSTVNTLIVNPIVRLYSWIKGFFVKDEEAVVAVESVLLPKKKAKVKRRVIKKVLPEAKPVKADPALEYKNVLINKLSSKSEAMNKDYHHGLSLLTANFDLLKGNSPAKPSEENLVEFAGIANSLVDVAEDISITLTQLSVLVGESSHAMSAKKAVETVNHYIGTYCNSLFGDSDILRKAEYIESNIAVTGDPTRDLINSVKAPQLVKRLFDTSLARIKEKTISWFKEKTATQFLDPIRVHACILPTPVQQPQVEQNTFHGSHLEQPVLGMEQLDGFNGETEIPDIGIPQSSQSFPPVTPRAPVQHEWQPPQTTVGIHSANANQQKQIDGFETPADKPFHLDLY